MKHIPEITRWCCFMYSPKYREYQFYVYGSVILGMMMSISVCYPGSGLF